MSCFVEESITVRVAELRRCSDGIIEILMAEGSRVSVDEMVEVLEAQERITRSMAGVLVDTRGTVSTSREALEAVANNPVNDLTAATALLVDSPVSTRSRRALRRARRGSARRMSSL